MVILTFTCFVLSLSLTELNNFKALCQGNLSSVKHSLKQRELSNAEKTLNGNLLKVSFRNVPTH